MSRPALAAGSTLLLVLLVLVFPVPGVAGATREHRVELSARMFAFDPARIYVRQGDRVVIALYPEDVVHGVYIDGYGLQLETEPGKPVEAAFIADRVGKFKYRCSVTCGPLHPFMIGELVVGPNTPFWRAVVATVVVVGGTLVTVRAWEEQTGRAEPGE